MRSGNSRILPHHKQAFDLAVHHVEEVALMGMVACNSWKPAKSPVVLFSRESAVVRLQQADYVLVDVPPPACLVAVLAVVRRQILRIHTKLGHRQITGQDVVEGWDIG